MSTLAELRTRVRQRTDNEHTGGFIEDAELNQLINTKVLELYELLVLEGLHRSESTYTISPTSTSPAASSYNLPAGLFAVLGVYGQYSATEEGWWLDRHDHRVMPNPYAPDYASSYRVIGSTIEFNPCPTAGIYTIRYVQIPAVLADDSDTFDGALGWDEWIVLACALDVLDKEDGDPNTCERLAGKLAHQTQRIKRAAQNQEMSNYVGIAKVRVSAFDSIRLPGDFTNRGYRGFPL